MENIDLIQTFNKLLHSYCASAGEAIESDEYVVYRSSDFSKYYGVNFITLKKPLSLVRAMELFREYFDPTQFHHMAFACPSSSDNREFVSDAISLGFDVERCSTMWRPLEATLKTSSSNLVWLEPREKEDIVRQAFAAVSVKDGLVGCVTEALDLFEWKADILERLGGGFVALTAHDRFELLCVTSYFAISSRAMVQDLVTVPGFRRQGYASTLICEFCLAARRRLGVETIFTESDLDSGSLPLFERTGFKSFGETLFLVRRERL
jgi:hypothetical protein